MTKNVYTIEQAYSMNSKGRDYKDGWHVMVNGNWGNTYRYKADAKAAVEQCIAEDKASETMVVKNLMTGQDVEIPADTPWCCNPASETYWSM